MGYGWIGDALTRSSHSATWTPAYLFGPLLTGQGPAGPGPSTLEPTFDCSAA